MALVAYSDSEEDDSDNAPAAKRLKRDDSPPPLPASFLNLYSSTVRVANTDDPSLHAGRKRIVAHVEGNWPTHVYLEWLPTPKDSTLLNTLLSAIPTTTPLNSLLQTPLQVPLPLHISLSAPLILHTTTKDSFLSTLTTRLEPHLQRLRSPITVSPSSISWHSNEDGSRYFLVLKLRDAEGHDGALKTLSKLLHTSNDVAAAYGQPRLYTRKDKDTAKKAKDDPSSSFHISIAWTLPSSDRNLDDENAKLKTPEVEKLMKKVSDMVVSFDAVKVRIGQTVTALKVSGSKSMEGRRGLFG